MNCLMKYPILNTAKMKSLFKLTLLLVFSMMVFTIHAQLPQRPVPPRLVNDFADILNASEEQALERKLVNYNDTTSTQITIVTVTDLQGYDKAQFAVELASDWGVGQKGKDNGLLILVKPKQGNSRGQAYIAVGYGLEEFVPDATVKIIVEYEMIPSFREGKIYEGLNITTSSLMGLLSGKFHADQYAGEDEPSLGDIIGTLALIILLIVTLILYFLLGSHYSTSSRRSGLWWLFILARSARNSSGSSWSNFSGGSGSFGGGSSFGGFGGGGFGGGGAGGSW